MVSQPFARLRSSQGGILYGGDYNPEQWPESVWKEDMRLFKEAHINEVTLNVFSWALLQPSEDVYDFSMLDKIVDLCKANGLKIVMATSTGAMPPWLSKAHPDVNRVGYNGEQFHHSGRENFCATSPTFLTLAPRLSGKLAEHYVSRGDAGSADSPIVAWHVSNEYCGFCWCERCAAKFREWLKSRYGTIEKLNEAWDTNMWSHTYHSFEEIDPPSALGDGMPTPNQYVTGHAVLGGYSLDYRRFYGEQVLHEYELEKAAIRHADPTALVTTNMMGTFNDYDYNEWRADHAGAGTDTGVDFVSWDSYPGLGEDAAAIDLRHDLMRGVGGQKPWMLMEQAPSNQNWMPYCYVKRPGQMEELSWQAVAHGADAVQFFQMRQARSGCEKFHSGVISSDGTDQSRTFQECAALGGKLEKLSANILATVPQAGQVAIIYDWNSWWGLQFSVGPTSALEYVHEVQRWYRELHRRNIAVDIVSATDDLSAYRAVIAPCLYMLTDAITDNLKSYVSGGGRLMLTPMSALADRHDELFLGQAPVPLRHETGVWVEETDSLAPDTPVPLVLSDQATDIVSANAQPNGNAKPSGSTEPSGNMLFNILRADPGTQVLATYGSQFYQGTPALTFKAAQVDNSGSQSSDVASGVGGILYCATMPDEAGVRAVVDCLLAGRGVRQIASDPLVEITRRTATAQSDTDKSAHDLVFVINTAEGARDAVAPESGVDLLTGQHVSQGQKLELASFGTVIISVQ